MTAAKIHLEGLIAKRLDGDRRRAFTLFEDDALHAQLALIDDVQGYLKYRKATFDGWYMVRSGDSYDVYYQERGDRWPGKLFDSAREAAHHFFSESQYAPFESGRAVEMPVAWWQKMGR